MTRRLARRLAPALAVLWLVVMELAPNLHVALHDRLAPHVHDAAGGMVVRVTFGAVDETVAHRHADGTLHRAAPAPARRGGGGARIDLAHGAGSLAHHALLWQAPPPPVTSPIAVPRRIEIVAERAAIAPWSCTPGRAVARGPPIG